MRWRSQRCVVNPHRPAMHTDTDTHTHTHTHTHHVTTPPFPHSYGGRSQRCVLKSLPEPCTHTHTHIHTHTHTHNTNSTAHLISNFQRQQQRDTHTHMRTQTQTHTHTQTYTHSHTHTHTQLGRVLPCDHSLYHTDSDHIGSLSGDVRAYHLLFHVHTFEDIVNNINNNNNNNTIINTNK